MTGGEVCMDASIDKACAELDKASKEFAREQELYRLVSCKAPVKDVLLKIETSADWTNEEKVKLKTKFEDIYKFNQKQESKQKQLERAKAFLLRNCKDVIDDIHITKNAIRVSLTTLDSQGLSVFGAAIPGKY